MFALAPRAGRPQRERRDQEIDTIWRPRRTLKDKRPARRLPPPGNATRRSAVLRRRRASARRTTGSASATTQSARRTGKQATRTASRRIDAATTRLDAFATQAQRALLIQVGAAATLRDNIAQTAQTYTNFDKMARELDRFERRGERVLKRSQQTAKRNRREVARDVRHAQDGVRQEAAEVVDRIKNLA